MQRPVQPITIALLALAGTSCLDSPASADGTAPIVGTWTYTGTQNTGTTASLQGAVVFTNSSATSYGGSLDVVESVAGNQNRRIIGAISGRMPTTTSVDFDVLLGSAQRHHIGSLVADTLSGTWFELAADNSIVAGGTYRAIRSKQ